MLTKRNKAVGGPIVVDRKRSMITIDRGSVRLDYSDRNFLVRPVVLSVLWALIGVQFRIAFEMVFTF